MADATILSGPWSRPQHQADRLRLGHAKPKIAAAVQAISWDCATMAQCICLAAALTDARQKGARCLIASIVDVLQPANAGIIVWRNCKPPPTPWIVCTWSIPRANQCGRLSRVGTGQEGMEREEAA
jgi:hypothetical protein